MTRGITRRLARILRDMGELLFLMIALPAALVLWAVILGLV